MPRFQYLSQFANAQNREWKNIFESESLTLNQIDAIEIAFQPFYPLLSADADLVVFGSLARNECTVDSDVDWTLLIDGQVSEQHYDSGIQIKSVLEAKGFTGPGSSGMFGQNTFGHDLVHYIGGQGDTNHNISKRILLVLEADKLKLNEATDASGTAFDRVKKAIIKEYIRHDSGFSSVSKTNARVPRFLLNDIIRFWRTMCVDFAFKQKEQDGDKWGIRNIKLRMSRKLIYLKGLLMCFSCYGDKSIGLDNIAEHLHDLSKLTPLDTIVRILGDKGIDNLLADLIDQYDKFLASLNERSIRNALKDLKMQSAYENEVFLKEREVATKFQDYLTAIFESTAELRDFTRSYLIF